jgi:hypothetical protein
MGVCSLKQSALLNARHRPIQKSWTPPVIPPVLGFPCLILSVPSGGDDDDDDCRVLLDDLARTYSPGVIRPTSSLYPPTRSGPGACRTAYSLFRLA